MFEKILVANRGEIAVRIIRACKELNIRTVAVYSEVDANSMHVQMADEAICIGKAAASESYLRIDRIISAAEIADVDAIHPGYGFLSENAHFAEVCESCNIRFIGPSPRAMSALEDKAISRALAKKAGIRVYTIALGTPGGEVTFGFGLYQNRIPVPPDPPTMRAIAAATGGKMFDARTAKSASHIYTTLGSSIGRQEKNRVISSWFAAGAAGFLIAAVGAGLLFESRLS